MSSKKIVLVLLLLFLPIATMSADETSNDNLPLTLQLDEHNGDITDYVDISFNDYEVKGTHIGIKLNVEHAIDQNGKVPAWNMFRFVIYDDLGKAYTTSQPSGFTTESPDYVPGFSVNGTMINVVWGYSHLWPTLGFYGTMYIPWYKTNLGTDDVPTTAPTTISKIRIVTNTKSNARKEIIANFFELVDATLNIPEKKDLWIGDVKVLHDFDSLTAGDVVTKHGTILDMTKLPSNSPSITISTNAKLYVRKMLLEDYNKLVEANSGDGSLDWQKNYPTTGQPFTFSQFVNDPYGKGLKWEYGSYLMDYDPNLNSYGSLGLSLKSFDWKGALGLTIWVKNPQAYPASFNLEFSEAEEGGAERWNLNNDYYRKIYAYDTKTGEEYAFHTMTVVYLPANFEGWLRIPFSEYEVPTWSLNNEWTDGKLDLNKEHKNIYITSQFVINDGVTLYFDNVGVYHEDFEVGKLFEREKPSIADCLAMENYKVGE